MVGSWGDPADVHPSNTKPETLTFLTFKIFLKITRRVLEHFIIKIFPRHTWFLLTVRFHSTENIAGTSREPQTPNLKKKSKIK